MSNPATAAKKPEAPKATVPSAPAPSASPPVAPAPAKEVKVAGHKLPEYSTPEEAVAEAKKRTKGAQRAFTVSLAGITKHLIAFNHDQASLSFITKAGGTVTEIGWKEKAAKAPPTADAFFAMLNAMPAEERAKFEALVGKK